MRAKVEALWVQVAEIEMLPEQLFHQEFKRTKGNCEFPPMRRQHHILGSANLAQYKKCLHKGCKKYQIFQ